MNINKNLIKYFETDLDTNFIKYFYGISINQKDIKDFVEYSNTTLYRNNGLSPSKISKLTKVSRRKIEHWIYNGNKPFIIRLLEHYLILGKPKYNLKWISINSTRGGLFIGPWIQAPNKINNYNDVYKVIKQLKELPEYKEKSKYLKLSSHLINKINMLGFFLGMFLGDASKTGINRKQRVTRRVHIRLSKGYPTNERLGCFVSMCANRLGLRMGKRKDCPAGKRNIHAFYTWISQSSLLFQWMFSACLGLKDNELTTYDPVRMKWILDSPKEFKISFLQGLADSDGFVDFSSHQIGIITEPNTRLIKDVFDSLNVNTTPKLFTVNKLWSLMANFKDAHNLPLFSPIVRSYRYIEMEKLFKANRIKGHWPSWLAKKIEYNINKGVKGTELVKKILDEEGIAIRTKNIQRRVKKLEV